MYKIERLDGNGNWVLWSWHKNAQMADINYAVRIEAGDRCRMILHGEIIRGG